MIEVEGTLKREPNVQWYADIDYLDFSESGTVDACFRTADKNQTNKELRRFTLALADFVKNYR